MRHCLWPARVTMPGMTDDPHAEANAEQVRLLLEALAQPPAEQAPELEPFSGPDGPDTPATSTGPPSGES